MEMTVLLLGMRLLFGGNVPWFFFFWARGKFISQRGVVLTTRSSWSCASIVARYWRELAGCGRGSENERFFLMTYNGNRGGHLWPWVVIHFWLFHVGFPHTKHNAFA